MIQKDEPGTLKYAALIPREDDFKTVYAIEEYVLTQTLLQNHLTT